jgi:hypothetical protein
MIDENPQTEFDSPWKQIIQLYFEDFMLFFFPQAYEQIDWTKQPEFLDKELEQVVRDAELGKHLADKKSKNLSQRWFRNLGIDSCGNPIPGRVELWEKNVYLQLSNL